jgi:hypothetical protein
VDECIRTKAMSISVHNFCSKDQLMNSYNKLFLKCNNEIKNGNNSFVSTETEYSNRMDSLEPISTKTRNILIKDMANFFILATTHGSAHYFVNGNDWHQQVM